ncbi:hypothetical protein [Sphingomonas sp.]|uniref:hypothetical protein n=1 Tax=Sphingomonas sp. TaxID=28214 RepID=UPI003AFF61EE
MALLLSAVTAPVAPLSTTMPYEALVRCVRDRLAPAGRVTAINTAAGTLLDFAFDTVGSDGKVASARLSFTIEDHGTERSLAVTAPSPADAGLAQQYQKQVGVRCAAPAAQGAP